MFPARMSRASADGCQTGTDPGRDLKGQAGELTQKGCRYGQEASSALTETAKDGRLECGQKLRASVSEQKAAGADMSANVADMIRRAAYEFDTEMHRRALHPKAAASSKTYPKRCQIGTCPKSSATFRISLRKQPDSFLRAGRAAGFCGRTVSQERAGQREPAGRRERRSAANVGGATAGHVGHDRSTQRRPLDLASARRRLRALSHLVQTEIRLARAELADKAAQAGMGSACWSRAAFHGPGALSCC